MYIHNDLNYIVIERTCDEAFQALRVQFILQKNLLLFVELFIGSKIAQKNFLVTLSKLLKNSVPLENGFS